MSLPDWSDADFQAAAPVLDEWAGILALPREVAYALVSQESRFKPGAFRAEPQINDASYGLTQILYRTAQGMGYRGTPQGLYDPETNAQLGLGYFATLYRQYGDLAQALSAYNSGHATGSTAGASYASQVLSRAGYFAELFTGGDDAAIDTSTSPSFSNALSPALVVGVAVVGFFAIWRAWR